MRLATGVRTYIESRRGDLNPGTRRELRYVLRDVTRVIGPDLLVRNLKRKHVELYMGSIDHLAVSTRRQRLSVLKVFCRWNVAHGYLKSDPTLGYNGPRIVIGVPRELTKPDVQAVLTAVPDARGRLIVFLAVHELLRVSEIAKLVRDEIDLDRRLALIHGKGSKQRWVPISDETHTAMLHYIRETPGRTGPLIRSYRRPAHGLTSQAIGDLVAQWMRDAGIKESPYDGKSAHAFRHTGIGSMLDNGADVRDARDAAGLANLSTLEIYGRKRRAESRLRQVMGQETYEKGEPAA